MGWKLDKNQTLGSHFYCDKDKIQIFSSDLVGTLLRMEMEKEEIRNARKIEGKTR